ncbi:hypothetical protein PO909_008069 [Leuciscus waleckii]
MIDRMLICLHKGQERALQFGQYWGKTLKWLLSYDIGYASMVLAVHQREREGGDTTQSAIMGNKDALLRYAALFPDMMAAISECRVREGTGTPAQEDMMRIGFGKFASMSFKDVYEAVDRASPSGLGSRKPDRVPKWMLCRSTSGEEMLRRWHQRLQA